MRHLLILILVFSVWSAQAQSTVCDQLLITQFDSTKEVYVRNLKEGIIIKADEKNKLSLALIEMERTIILSLLVTGAGDCVDETSKLNITFRDGAKLEMTNNGGFNCDAEFSIFFGGDFGHKKELAMITSKEIQTIKVTTRKSSVDKSRNNVVEVALSPDQSKAVLTVANCLTH